MTDNNNTDVVVLGAGIVGVSAAFAARRRGLSVVLVDRREPGSETSYGNAGILSSGSIFPLNQPSLFGNLPKYLSNRHPALRWNIGWALRNPGWIARFLANSAQSQVKPRAVALQGLIKASLKLHRDWIVQRLMVARGGEQRAHTVGRPGLEGGAKLLGQRARTLGKGRTLIGARHGESAPAHHDVWPCHLLDGFT